MLRCVFISDTHSLARDLEVPDGDVLIHSGDLSGNGKLSEFLEQVKWLASFPHKHKILVAGNHDVVIERWPFVARPELEANGITYLENSEVVIEGIKFYGSPIQPFFNNWAFNVKEESRRALVWAQIPDDTDVLVTHCPPHGILDFCEDGHTGCEALWWEVMERVKPQIHAFGHIHEGHGKVDFGHTLFLNASICDGGYNPINRPWVVDVKIKDRTVKLKAVDFLQPMHFQCGQVAAGPFYFNLVNALVEGSRHAKRRVDFREP